MPGGRSGGGTRVCSGGLEDGLCVVDCDGYGWEMAAVCDLENSVLVERFLCRCSLLVRGGRLRLQRISDTDDLQARWSRAGSAVKTPSGVGGAVLMAAAAAAALLLILPCF